MADLIVIFTVVLLCLASFTLNADDSEQAPSPELLEFLGEWETKDGEWFNPLWILKNLKTASQQTDQNEQEAKDNE